MNYLFPGFDVRLAEGSTNWGRVEVRHSGICGAVCSDKWDDAAANVTCRQLDRGFIGGIAIGNVRTVDMPYWLRDASCTGNETSLIDCRYTQWGEPVFFCSAAYVLCYINTGTQIKILIIYAILLFRVLLNWAFNNVLLNRMIQF